MPLHPEIVVRTLNVEPTVLEVARKVLSANELDRMATFRNEERRRSFAAGRIAARYVMSEQLGCAPKQVPLEVRTDGSVGIRGDGVHLSISHSDTRAVVAVSPTPVGVDVERIVARPAMLFRYMLHPDEYRLVDTTDLPDDDKLVLFWTLKESVLKGRRTGLRQSPKDLRLKVDVPDGRASILTPGDDPDWVARFEHDGDYVTSVAWPLLRP